MCCCGEDAADSVCVIEHRRVSGMYLVCSPFVPRGDNFILPRENISLDNWMILPDEI